MASEVNEMSRFRLLHGAWRGAGWGEGSWTAGRLPGETTVDPVERLPTRRAADFSRPEDLTQALLRRAGS